LNTTRSGGAVATTSWPHVSGTGGAPGLKRASTPACAQQSQHSTQLEASHNSA
jgi:hypothetical protein